MRCEGLGCVFRESDGHRVELVAVALEELVANELVVEL